MFNRTYGSYEAINKATYNDAHSSRLVHIDLNYWTPTLFSRALDPVWKHFNINNICLMPACKSCTVQPLILVMIITSPTSCTSK